MPCGCPSKCCCLKPQPRLCAKPRYSFIVMIVPNGGASALSITRRVLSTCPREALNAVLAEAEQEVTAFVENFGGRAVVTNPDATYPRTVTWSAPLTYERPTVGKVVVG